MLKAKIAVLCSGGGTNLQAILNAEEAGLIPHGEVALVAADHRDAYALTRAKRYGIEGAVVDRKEIPSPIEREKILLKMMKEKNIDLIVLAGFLSVLEGEILDEYEGRILNVHPALIPSFCGKGMYGLHVHEAALARGVKVTGATVHFVTKECDGGPILMQKAVKVEEGDTPKSLQQRVMREAEWVILPEAVELVSKQITEGK